MIQFIQNFFKGVAMGTANVIPGVSGGTIALITGIFERLIDAIKSFNGKAVKLLFTGKFKEFAQHTDFVFLLSIFLGIGVAIVSLARLFDYLFTNYPIYIWAYFFGLVLASVYFVGKTVKKWDISAIVTFLIGTGIAFGITQLTPATQNDNFIYLIICGVVAVCSMILPGLSGSFVLILMGNYQLVAIDAINNLDFAVLLPVIVGAVLGLLAFSHFLSWLLKRYKNQTISLLTGFILGSISILWPWKETQYLMLNGELLLKDGQPIVERYMPIIPKSLNAETWFAIVLVILGIATIAGLEFMVSKDKKN